MTEIPTWWLGLSAAFFVVNIILFIGMTIALAVIVKMLKELQPKMAVMMLKVEAASEKAQLAAAKVEALAASAQATVSNVGTKAKTVAGAADGLAHVAAFQVQRFLPAVGAVVSGYKLLRAIMDMRSKSHRADANRRPLPAKK